MSEASARFLLSIAAAAALGAAPARAHHSFSAVYDANSPITLTGDVTEIEWRNPHIYIYVNVRDESGQATVFAVEGSTPNMLYRRGWRKDDLRVGDTITVQGFMARDGSAQLNSRRITLPNGRVVFTGSTDGGPTEAELD